MDFALKNADLAAAANEKADALVVLVPEGFKPGVDALSALIQTARSAGDFEGKPGQTLQLYAPAGFGARRVTLAGVGAGLARHVAQAVRSALGGLKDSPVRKLALVLAALDQPGEDVVRAAVLACGDATYVYTYTKAKARASTIGRITLLSPAGIGRQGVAEGRALAEGIAFAKEWGNRPGNHATPTLLGQAARTLARLPRVQVEVLGPKEVAALGMGSFIAVAKGSVEPLRFIVLRYNGAAKSVAPHVLVGKGITFDTGGISIKPAGEMDEMKFDMCGAASVLGTFRALGEFQPAINVVGLIASCENMPDGQALKPGDVVTSMSGQTIEVLNTDAEGRLVLCDALTYAERFKPQSVVDIATLTGACVISLGGVRSGLFSTDEALAADLQAAGEQAGDLCWRLPLDDDYADGLKTHFADVANVAGRAGGAITAAKFLQRFASAYPWAHLDIAGTAWKGGAAKGSTGRPVGLLFQYLLNLAAKPVAAEAVAATRKPGGRRKSAAPVAAEVAPAKAARRTPAATVAAVAAPAVRKTASARKAAAPAPVRARRGARPAA